MYRALKLEGRIIFRSRATTGIGEPVQEQRRERLLKCVEAMLKRDRNADAEWVVMPRLPL